MISATNSVTSSASSAANTGANSADMNAAQDRFLKLLVAQLNNQDPMNPLDNAQMTSQMAQINTVTGIQQVNDTLKSMAAQFTAMQVLQGSSMVGHKVLVDSNTLTINNGSASAAIALTERADNVKIDVMSPSGNVLDSFNLGALEAGQHSFNWDASNYAFSAAPSFKVSASLAGKPIDAAAMAQDSVTAVGAGNGVLQVQLQGRSAVAYSAIKAIL